MMQSRRRLTMVFLVVLVAFFPGGLPAGSPELNSLEQHFDEAIFAGGCFWCMEHPFDEADGVVSTTSGYTGGELAFPSYSQVSSGKTRHVEAIRVVYDIRLIDYEKLLEIFWRNIDPTQVDGQFCDRGPQYRTAIFYRDELQKNRALESLDNIRMKHFPGSELATEIIPARKFYPAEDYHQDFYLKNPVRYKIYRWRCGRDQRLQDIWGRDGGGQ